MISHPLIMAAMVLDLSALATTAASGFGAFRIAAAWNPASAGAGQLLLESQAEAASILGRLGLFLFAAATALWLVTLSSVMPALVPGAMCGTGVLQASGPAGAHAIMYRLTAVGVFYLWAAVDRLNRSHPMGPLTRPGAGIMLLLLPLATLSIVAAAATLAGMDSHRPVDCCMVLYDQFQNLEQAGHTAGVSNTGWTAAYGILSVMLAGSGIAVYRRPAPLGMAAMGVLALAWTPAAGVTLTRTLSAYLYGVLHHHCPWCLFTESGAWMGFPLLLAAAVILLEALTAPALWRVAAGKSVLETAVRQRAGRAGRRVAAAVVVFVGTSAAPALVWHWRWGVWITG
ncbi:MAG: hypothetical protein ABIL58_13005 [Pseudomonadota bacterium]